MGRTCQPIRENRNLGENLRLGKKFEVEMGGTSSCGGGCGGGVGVGGGGGGGVGGGGGGGGGFGGCFGGGGGGGFFVGGHYHTGQINWGE